MRHRKPVAIANAFAPEELARAAWLYYVDGMTQVKIARVLRVSRAKVIALLAAARDGGIVRMRIDEVTARQAMLERALVARYGLQEAVVAPEPARGGDAALVVGHAAGSWLGAQLRDGLAIGIGWGATLHAAVKAIDTTARARIAVISLLGGVTHSRTMMPATVARRLADAFAGDCFQLTAPLIVKDQATAQALLAEPGLDTLRQRARHADLALVSVGDVSDRATLFRENIVPRSELARLKRAGAVGDLLCRFLNERGRIVDHPLNQRMMAITLDDLRQIPRIAIASGGRRKVAALEAALAAVPVSVLITDESAARGLLHDRPALP